MAHERKIKLRNELDSLIEQIAAVMEVLEQLPVSERENSLAMQKLGTLLDKYKDLRVLYDPPKNMLLGAAFRNEREK